MVTVTEAASVATSVPHASSASSVAVVRDESEASPSLQSLTVTLADSSWPVKATAMSTVTPSPPSNARTSSFSGSPPPAPNFMAPPPGRFESVITTERPGSVGTGEGTGEGASEGAAVGTLVGWSEGRGVGACDEVRKTSGDVEVTPHVESVATK